MSMKLEKITEATLDGTLGREIARMESEQAAWRRVVDQGDSIIRQFKDQTRVGSAYAQAASGFKNFLPPPLESRDLLDVGSATERVLSSWQESQRAQHESMRKLLEPLDEIRKNFMREIYSQRVTTDTILRATLGHRFKSVFDNFSGADTVGKMWAQQMAASEAQANQLFANMAVGRSIQERFKTFEHVDKQWTVPSNVLEMVGSLQRLQDQIGKIALPTVDWSSAAALAKLLGQAGLEEQLAHLGIGPDGSLNDFAEVPEKGLLSRKQSDFVALLGLLFAVIGIWMTIQIFIYQEDASQAQQAKNDEQAARQVRQLESLHRLVEQVLQQSTDQHEERFVVRTRTATVRSKPDHGAALEGKLLPNEVVRAIGKDGKWVEIEYYHWLHGDYRTGWVLKKYLERVPANHFR